MKQSESRILTTHVGRLERPADLTAAMNRDPRGRPYDRSFTTLLRASVDTVVREQVAAGIDVVCDGEFGKISWVTYLSSRLGGFELTPRDISDNAGVGMDRRAFHEFYEWADSGGPLYYSSPGNVLWGQCTEPVTYVGHDALQEDIDALKAALEQSAAGEGFMPSTSPASVTWGNGYYGSAEEYLFALADALHEEYQMIVDAGLVVQIDDPVLPITWDRMLPDVDAGRFHEACEVRIEAVNRAIGDIPRDRVRYHLCWGSWHGPHSTDVSLEILLPLLKRLNVGGWAFEAANVRHEHEWRSWQLLGDDDRLLIPGVVSHATDVLEHPQLVADRIMRFARIVGPERVIAGTDCGLGYRVHPQIAWAKLRMLSQGAKIASEALYGAKPGPPD